MVLMLQLLHFMMDMVLINQSVSSILLILMVVIFVLSGILNSNGWNTAQALIKRFALLAVCLVKEVIIRKPLYPMVFKTGKVPWRSSVHISAVLHTKLQFLLGKLVSKHNATLKEM